MKLDMRVMTIFDTQVQEVSVHSLTHSLRPIASGFYCDANEKRLIRKREREVYSVATAHGKLIKSQSEAKTSISQLVLSPCMLRAF